METLFYLYGIVPADAPAPPAELEGVEARPVRLVRAGPVAALVGEIPAADYLDEALDARMRDLAWVGERALAHERVLTWYVDRGVVLPLGLFSLYRGEAGVRERLERDGPAFLARLEELRGRREWGVKLWRRDEAVGEHLDELSPAIRALSEEMERVPPGRRFLLGKKREALRADELRSASVRVARQLFAELQERARRAVLIPLPAAAAEGGRTLALQAAFLVDEDAFAAFQHGVTAAAARCGPLGFEVEFTGPWPPYHFARPDGE